MVLFIKKIILIFFLLTTFNAYGESNLLPSAGFNCSDGQKTFEFVFNRSNQEHKPIVFKRIEGSFREIGNILAEKQGAYVIWEDKEFFKSTDFAWTFDKVTSKLSSIVLSVGLGIENTKKIPNTMSCIQKIFYY